MRKARATAAMLWNTDPGAVQSVNPSSGFGACARAGDGRIRRRIAIDAVAPGPVRHAAWQVGELHTHILIALAFVQPPRLARVGESDTTGLYHVMHNDGRRWIGDHVEQFSRATSGEHGSRDDEGCAATDLARYAPPAVLPWSRWPAIDDDWSVPAIGVDRWSNWLARRVLDIQSGTVQQSLGLH